MPTPSTCQRKRPKILVVDDEPAIRELLKLQLSAAGYDVVLADDAFAARRLLYKAAPDVMVVDAHMPYVSGVEFVSTLIAEPSLPWVPVIFITGRRELMTEASGETYLRREREVGKFVRTLRLPAPVVEKEVKATYEDGLLIIHLRKVAPAVANRIVIK